VKEPATKTCVKCGKVKPITEFHLSGRRAGRYRDLPRRRTTCRQCCNPIRNKQRAENRIVKLQPKLDASLRELAITARANQLFAIAEDIRELFALNQIAHPLFCALASRAGELVAEIEGRRRREREGETVELQRRWVEENGFEVRKRA
jgi:hypothetical protein